MARTISEIMNRELFTLAPDELVGNARRHLVALDISSAPVVVGGRAIGFVSLRDLLHQGDERTVRDAMTSPPIVLHTDDAIEHGAVLLVEARIHHAVVVDRTGAAVGFVSAIDFLAALMQMPVAHPSTFPHYDPATGVVWSDPIRFDFEHVEAAPAAPGVFEILRTTASTTDRVCGAEASTDVRARLIEILSGGTWSGLDLANPKTRRQLCFRCAAVSDVEQRAGVLAEAIRRGNEQVLNR